MEFELHGDTYFHVGDVEADIQREEEKANQSVRAWLGVPNISFMDVQCIQDRFTEGTKICELVKEFSLNRLIIEQIVYGRAA
jgi:hypothetical protein